MIHGSFFPLPLWLVHSPSEASPYWSSSAPLSSLKPNVFSPVFWSTWAENRRWPNTTVLSVCISLGLESVVLQLVWLGNVYVSFKASIYDHILCEASLCLSIHPYSFLHSTIYLQHVCFSILNVDQMWSSVFYQMTSDFEAGNHEVVSGSQGSETTSGTLVDVRNYLQGKGKKSRISSSQNVWKSVSLLQKWLILL